MLQVSTCFSSWSYCGLQKMKLLLLLTCNLTLVQPVPWSLPQDKGELNLHRLTYSFAQASFLLLHKDLAETVHHIYIQFA